VFANLESYFILVYFIYYSLFGEMNLEQKKIVVCGSFLLMSEEFKKLKSIMDNKKKQKV